MIVSPWPPFEDLQTIWGISYRGWHVVTHTCMWCDQDNDSLTQVVVEQTSSSVCLGNLFFLGASSQSFILYLTSPIWLFFLRLVNPAQVSFDLVRSAVQRLPPPVSRISSLSVSKGCVYFARYIAWWFNSPFKYVVSFPKSSMTPHQEKQSYNTIHVQTSDADSITLPSKERDKQIHWPIGIGALRTQFVHTAQKWKGHGHGAVRCGVSRRAPTSC